LAGATSRALGLVAAHAPLRTWSRWGSSCPVGGAGYRRYGIRELSQLNALSELRARFGVELAELEFALRLRRELALQAAVETWLAGTTVPEPEQPNPAWVEWEQRKHERLLVTDAA
jgi:hypothetical protein